MRWIGNENYGLIKNGLKASVLRNKAISNNIANVNTKGYKKFKVAFEETLGTNSDNMKTTSSKHFEDFDNQGEVKVYRDTSGSMRSDGNNVDIDSEMMNLAANTLKYNALVSEANKMFRLNKMVIKGGE